VGRRVGRFEGIRDVGFLVGIKVVGIRPVGFLVGFNDVGLMVVGSIEGSSVGSSVGL